METIKEIMHRFALDKSVLAESLYCADSPEKGVPCFFIFPLDIDVLISQGHVACDVDFRITGNFIIIAAGKVKWVAVEVIEHVLYL